MIQNISLLNRKQRRNLQKKRSKVRLCDYGIDFKNYQTEWKDVSTSSAQSSNKFKKLFKEYKFDIHKMLQDEDLKMKRHNISYEDMWLDREVYKSLSFFLEILKFKNRLSFDQIIEILSLFASRLNPITARCYFMSCITKFDFLTHKHQEKLDAIKVAILDRKDYDEDEFYERNELYTAFVTNEELVNINSNTSFVDKAKQMIAVCKKLRNSAIKSDFEVQEDFDAYYDDNEYVEVYRGFAIVGDEKIRKIDEFKRHECNDKILDESSSHQLDFYKKSQHAGRGVSYSFDKKVALAFAFRTMKAMRYVTPSDEIIRACVGKYHIQKKDIFAYTDTRSEREVLVKSNDYLESHTFLDHYEFFSNEVGAYNKTGMIDEPVFRKSSVVSVEEYSKIYEDTKIDKVFN